jgi:hypothetical protein
MAEEELLQLLLEHPLVHVDRAGRGPGGEMFISGPGSRVVTELNSRHRTPLGESGGKIKSFR